MTKLRKIKTSFLFGLVAVLALSLGVRFASMPKAQVAKAAVPTEYSVVETSMMAQIHNEYIDAGRFRLAITMPDLDTASVEANTYELDTTSTGLNTDLPSILRSLGLYDHVKVAGKTLSQWGDATCYANWIRVNKDSPKNYTITFPIQVNAAAWKAAVDSGEVSFTKYENGALAVTMSKVEVLEGALIPGYDFLTGGANPTVYKAGCDFVTEGGAYAYDVKTVAKTDVVSVKYVQNNGDGTGYFGVSLKGDDYAGSQLEVNQNYAYNYVDKISVNGNGVTGVTGKYGLYSLGSKGAGYYAFHILASEADMQTITIPAGTVFPSRAMTTLRALNSNNGVNIFYETKTDVTFVKQEDGSWAREIEATVSHAAIFHEASNYADTFGGIAIEGSNFASAPNTYAGDAKAAKTFARSENFLSHVLIDGASPLSYGEGFLNVWGNYGYFCFRPGNSEATSITILKGCKIPTYNALLYGYDEVYVISEDISFKLDEDGNWVLDNGVEAGEYETSINSVVYSRDNGSNWMMFTLSEKDYPKASETYNVKDVANRVSALNLYDKIVVDGYTLRSREGDKEPTINLWVADCFGVRVLGAGNSLDGAQKVTVRAGAQFPSYAYLTDGTQAFYVTTEEITFVNVGNTNGKWERQYKATFVVDGEVIATIPYLVSEGLVAPEVPEIEGYRGEWEAYVAEGNITVNAVYTAKTCETALTNISAVNDKDGFLILTLMNHDYQSAPGTWWGPNGADAKELLAVMRTLNFHVYGANGNEIKLGGDAIINLWGTDGYHLAFYLNGYSASNMPTQVTFKKGCEIPSYSQVLNGENFCFELIEDVTFIKQGDVWVRQSEAMS